MSKKIRIGIIGTGGISHAHMTGYKALEDVEVCAACDLDASRVKAFGEKYGIGQLYNDYNEMLKLKELDGVSICTWNNSHAAASIAALRAGKHVLCEKPMAMNAEEANEMARTARETGKLLMIGFVRRFAKDTGILKEFIDKGHLGNIYYGKAIYLRRCGNPGGWFADKGRSGGGPLIDLGVHFIDLLRYLMGKPKAVSVYGLTFSGIGLRDEIKGINRYKAADYNKYCDVEDMAAAMVRFDNGAAISIETSFSLNIKEDTGNLELFGTKAGAKLEPALEIYSQMEDYLVDISPKYTKSDDWFSSIFKNEIKHFTDCMAGRAECLSPAEDGVELMKILDAAYLSAKTGKEALIKS